MATRSERRSRKEDEQLERTYRATTSSGRRRRKSKKAAGNSNIFIICLVVIAIAAAIVVGSMALGSNDDLILENVSVAGVDVGGMTKHDAIDAVKDATADTYTRLDMIVQAMGYEAVITPEMSGAKLDVKAAVNKAYEFGRTGSAAQQAKDQLIASTSGYTVDLSDCLELNTEVIHSELETLGNQFSSLLKQSSVEVTGETPDLSTDPQATDGQTLMIHVGTPERTMDLEKVYKQVMDAYNSNIFTVEANCKVKEPTAIDLQSIYNKYCIKPVDASLDDKTYEIVPGAYGYGFDLEEAQSLLNDAAPGDVITLAFSGIAPEITEEDLSQLLFKDVLGKYTATSSDSDPGRDENLRVACEFIDGVVLYPGDVFSYNDTLGERTEARGFKPGPSYAGNETVYTIGGGICQVSSALYYCTLIADMDIVLRDFHGFATEYMPLGMDAVVSWGSLDFRFANNSNYPIMIDAVANGSSVTVQILGTDEKDYYVKMEYEILKTDKHEITYRTMSADNEKGYKDGDEIVKGYTGYDVNVYKCKYSKTDDALISRDYVDSSYYRRRDAVICSIISDGSDSETETTSPGISGDVSDGGGALPNE